MVRFPVRLTECIAEGAAGTWKTDARLVAPRIKTLAVKTQAEWRDPEWIKSTVKAEKWNVQIPMILNGFLD